MQSPLFPGVIRVRNPIGGQKARFTFLTKERLRIRNRRRRRRWEEEECRLNEINVGRGTEQVEHALCASMIFIFDKIWEIGAG